MTTTLTQAELDALKQSMQDRFGFASGAWGSPFPWDSRVNNALIAEYGSLDKVPDVMRRAITSDFINGGTQEQAAQAINAYKANPTQMWTNVIQGLAANYGYGTASNGVYGGSTNTDELQNLIKQAVAAGIPQDIISSTVQNGINSGVGEVKNIVANSSDGFVGNLVNSIGSSLTANPLATALLVGTGMGAGALGSLATSVGEGILGAGAAGAATVGSSIVSAATSGLLAAATGQDIGKSMLTGAISGGLSANTSDIASGLVGADNIKSISDATGLSTAQVSKIIGNAVTSGVTTAAVNGTDPTNAILTSLASNGLGSYATNVVNAIDPGKLNAVANAVGTTTKVITTAAIRGTDISTALTNSAGSIIGSAVNTKTPTTTPSTTTSANNDQYNQLVATIGKDAADAWMAGQENVQSGTSSYASTASTTTSDVNAPTDLIRNVVPEGQGTSQPITVVANPHGPLTASEVDQMRAEGATQGEIDSLISQYGYVDPLDAESATSGYTENLDATGAGTGTTPSSINTSSLLSSIGTTGGSTSTSGTGGSGGTTDVGGTGGTNGGGTGGTGGGGTGGTGGGGTGGTGGGGTGGTGGGGTGGDETGNIETVTTPSTTPTPTPTPTPPTVVTPNTVTPVTTTTTSPTMGGYASTAASASPLISAIFGGGGQKAEALKDPLAAFRTNEPSQQTEQQKSPLDMADINNQSGFEYDPNTGILKAKSSTTPAVGGISPIFNAATGGSTNYNTIGSADGSSTKLNLDPVYGDTLGLKNYQKIALKSPLAAFGHADGGSIPGHNPEFFSEGGLGNRYVKGEGDGTSDSVPAMLASGEFVIPADVVSSLGNGDNDAGANVLDEFLRTIREHKRKADARQLPPDSKGPLAYLTQAKSKVRK